MKKFEVPEINISMFIRENIITTSEGPGNQSAVEAATASLTTGGLAEDRVFKITL